jgi:hypothetical protein
MLDIESPDYRVGRIAFRAYKARVGNATHDGRQIPDWDELGESIQRGWMAAAEAAITLRGKDYR